MKSIVIDGFEINEEYQKRLLNDLKEERVKTTADLEHYLKDHWYTRDNSLKSHLLLSRHPKKKNFALPFED